MLWGDVDSDDAVEDVDVKRSRCSCSSINRAASRSVSNADDITSYWKMRRKEEIKTTKLISFFTRHLQSNERQRIKIK